MEIKFYYQIDYIDQDGLANYIDSFCDNELEKAKEKYHILSDALACVDTNTKYVLDMYAFIYDEDDILDDTDIFIAQILPELELKI